MRENIVNEVRLARIQMSDSANPMLAIRYNRVPIAGESIELQPQKATITIDNNGGGGAASLRVTVALYTMDSTGTASTTTSYIYDAASGGGASVTDICETLGELVDELNKIPGITAYRMNAAADYSLATNDFVDVSATDIIGHEFMETLYRDADQIHYSAVRIGVPQFMDRGRIRLLGVSGTVTGATTGTLTVSIDPVEGEGGASSEKLVQSFTLVNTTETAYMDYNILDAPTIQGPLLIEASSADLSAASIVVRYVNAEV